LEVLVWRDNLGLFEFCKDDMVVVVGGGGGGLVVVVCVDIDS
jgi:hypothetical protein